MVVLIASVVLLVVVLLVVRREGRTLRNLPTLPAATPYPSAPPVTVVIPVRDESLNIARCLEGVLGQTQPPAEIIIVDDGSTDDTAAIAAAIVAQHAARSAVPIRLTCAPPLPEGWTGKCNACWHGAQQARGEWLLFLDADTAPQPDLIASLQAAARQHDLAAASVMPFVETDSLAEKMVLPITWQFTLTLLPVLRKFDPEVAPQSALANGQCLLVSRDAYFASGGHAAVRGKIIEDAAMARLLRGNGHRLGMFVALDHLRVRPYRSFRDVAQGLMKQANAGREMSGPGGLLVFAEVLAITALPPLVLLWAALAWLAVPDPAHALAALAALAACIAAFAHWRAMLRQLFSLPARDALLMPAGALLYVGIIAAGIARVEAKKGVMWKGRRYDG